MGNINIATLFVTFFYTGKFKYFPGTLGSLLSIFLYYIIMPLSENDEFFTNFLIYLLLHVTLLVFGLYYTSVYILYFNVKDPKEVVIDEVVGQGITLLACCLCKKFILTTLGECLNNILLQYLFSLVIPFFLFRVFDILKPWPINLVDQNITGAIGVMLDDLVAAIYSSITYAIVLLIIF